MEKFQVYVVEVLCELIQGKNINHTQFAQAVFESSGHHGRMWRHVRAKNSRSRELTMNELYQAALLFNTSAASILFLAEEKMKLVEKNKILP